MAPFIGDDEFQEEWFGEDDEGNSLHEVGLRGGWDAATRDQELDHDGVAAEVVFPGPDAATGTMGAPFGAGFNPVATHEPRAPARRGARVQPVGGRALPGQPGAPRRADRRARSSTTSTARIAEIRRAHADGLTGGIIIPPRWGGHESYTSYRYDPVWAVCEELQLPVHCHSGPAPQRGLRRGQRLDERLRLRDDLLHRAPAVVHAAHRRVRAVPAAQDGGHRSGVLLGRRPAVARRHDGDPRARHAQDGQHARDPHDAAERVLRPQRARSARRTRGAASSAAATRSASATSCGATTSRTPRARGRTRASS